MPEGPSAPADATGIHLAGSGSEGSATVTLGAGKQATIPITVEDPTEVDVVSCTITEEPIVLPAVFPGVRCETAYRPSHAAVFTANGQSTTLNVVNTCVPSASAVPPQPLEITPEFTG
jgi:hypothetical protein